MSFCIGVVYSRQSACFQALCKNFWLDKLSMHIFSSFSNCGCKTWIRGSSLCQNWLQWLKHGNIDWKNNKYTSVNGSLKAFWSLLNLACVSFSDLKYDVKLAKCFRLHPLAISKLNQYVKACFTTAQYSCSQNVQYECRPFFCFVNLSNQ